MAAHSPATHTSTHNPQGKAPLKVEVRDSATEGYGKARKVPMTFAQFLKRMGQGDETLYLTTQKVGVRARACVRVCVCV